VDRYRRVTRLTRRRKFFDTFGFLHLPGLLIHDIDWITSEFDAIWARRSDVHHDGSHRTIFPDSFLNASDVLARLIEYPVLSELCEELLGPGYAYYGGDGNYYSGDTPWHSDVFNVQDGEEAKSVVQHLKIAFYLDPLTSETGALRVIPGTHYTHDAFARAVQET
jgi:ectoine hydroxylase-related dioxygenase (phytanoyl-CoA dioxygenase family)